MFIKNYQRNKIPQKKEKRQKKDYYINSNLSKKEQFILCQDTDLFIKTSVSHTKTFTASFLKIYRGIITKKKRVRSAYFKLKNIAVPFLSCTCVIKQALVNFNY